MSIDTIVSITYSLTNRHHDPTLHLAKPSRSSIIAFETQRNIGPWYLIDFASRVPGRDPIAQCLRSVKCKLITRTILQVPLAISPHRWAWLRQS